MKISQAPNSIILVTAGFWYDGEMEQTREESKGKGIKEESFLGSIPLYRISIWGKEKKAGKKFSI